MTTVEVEARCRIEGLADLPEDELLTALQSGVRDRPIAELKTAVREAIPA
jgi:hypothetical protein